MIRRSAFGVRLPNIAYDRLPGALPPPLELPPPKLVRLRCGVPFERADQVPLKIGARLRTGQRFLLRADASVAMVATATGRVCEIGAGIGPFGQPYTEVSIECDARGDERDGAFAELAPSPSLEHAVKYLAAAPGAPPLTELGRSRRPVDTVIVNAVERDLLSVSAQFVLRHAAADLASGMAVLKQITEAERIVLVVARESLQNFGHLGAEVLSVAGTYPSGLPRMVIPAVLGRELPADMEPAEAGLLVLGAEAAASIGSAFRSGQLPLHKLVTLVDAGGRRTLLRARIGAPVGDLLAAGGITLADQDRLVLGGPMTGRTIHSELHPVEPDTDMVMVQAAGDVVRSDDYACINCGECVRICPARVPVNMLVRFLEARAYATAADEYDLHSCIECGLCAYVCVARIPIFQYIMLAKHELAQARAAAEVDHD
jgi:electron transport complex protein RnfC